jgi:hypothetical protein
MKEIHKPAGGGYYYLILRTADVLKQKRTTRFYDEGLDTVED